MEWETLIKIILLDLVLSGDNAVIIAMAAKNVPKEKRKTAILFGTGGAIILRLIFAFIILQLLSVKYIEFIGALLLIWITFKLLLEKEENNSIKSSSSLWGAIQTIIIADFGMSLDNVIAISGAADGHFGLIILGIAISIPIIIFGSQLILIAMEKIPFILYIGAGILTWTAGEMMVKEKMVNTFLNKILPTTEYTHYLVPCFLTLFVLLICIFINSKKAARE